MLEEIVFWLWTIYVASSNGVRMSTKSWRCVITSACSHFSPSRILVAWSERVFTLLVNSVQASYQLRKPQKNWYKPLDLFKYYQAWQAGS